MPIAISKSKTKRISSAQPDPADRRDKPPRADESAHTVPDSVRPIQAKRTALSDPILRLPEVLELFPVGRSTWYGGVQTGRYPQPVRLSVRTVGWRLSDIEELIHPGQ